MTELELAYAAGLFEGEGSVRINKPTARNLGALMVDMVNSDRELVEFFQQRWPGYFRPIIMAGNRRMVWRWRAAALVATRFLEAIRPYVRGEKGRRIDVAFEFQRQKKPSDHSSEYRARQWQFYERMKAMNLRGAPIGAQLQLITNSCPNAAAHRKADR